MAPDPADAGPDAAPVPESESDPLSSSSSSVAAPAPSADPSSADGAPAASAVSAVSAVSVDDPTAVSAVPSPMGAPSPALLQPHSPIPPPHPAAYYSPPPHPMYHPAAAAAAPMPPHFASAGPPPFPYPPAYFSPHLYPVATPPPPHHHVQQQPSEQAQQPQQQQQQQSHHQGDDSASIPTSTTTASTIATSATTANSTILSSASVSGATTSTATTATTATAPTPVSASPALSTSAPPSPSASVSTSLQQHWPPTSPAASPYNPAAAYYPQWPTPPHAPTPAGRPLVPPPHHLHHPHLRHQHQHQHHQQHHPHMHHPHHPHHLHHAPYPHSLPASASSLSPASATAPSPASPVAPSATPPPSSHPAAVAAAAAAAAAAAGIVSPLPHQHQHQHHQYAHLHSHSLPPPHPLAGSLIPSASPSSPASGSTTSNPTTSIATSVATTASNAATLNASHLYQHQPQHYYQPHAHSHHHQGQHHHHGSSVPTNPSSLPPRSSRPPHPGEHFHSAYYYDRDRDRDTRDRDRRSSAYAHFPNPGSVSSISPSPSSSSVSSYAHQHPPPSPGRRASRRRPPPSDASSQNGLHDHHQHHHSHRSDRKGNSARPPAVGSNAGNSNGGKGVSNNNSNNSNSNNNNNNNNNSNNSSNKNGNSGDGSGANATERDATALSLELDRAASKAVGNADDVTLALLLTSWANTLAEARAPHPPPQAAQFDAVLHASRALDIVAAHVVRVHRGRDSPVRKALAALFAIMLYGDESLHARLLDLVAEMQLSAPATAPVLIADAAAVVVSNQPGSNTTSSSKSVVTGVDGGDNSGARNKGGGNTQSGSSDAVQIAIPRLLAFLKGVALDLRAYMDVLPALPDTRADGSVVVPGAAAAVATAVPTSPADPDGNGPAAPDATKAVERALDVWRRFVARLQAEMALVLVLRNARQSLPNRLALIPSAADGANGDSETSQTASTQLPSVTAEILANYSAADTDELKAFFTATRHSVLKHLDVDLSARADRLHAVYWPHALAGAETAVFRVVRERAAVWLAQFDSAKRDIEARLDDAGIGFGPAAAVVDDKFPVLLAAGAGVAALVSSHQRSFAWAAHTAKLLAAMATAVRALETVADGELRPRTELREKFFAGLNAAFVAVDDVAGWSFAAVHDKVLHSLALSAGGEAATEAAAAVAAAAAEAAAAGATTDSNTTGTPDGVGADRKSGEVEGSNGRTRNLRFEEPPKTPKETAPGDGENGNVASRRKPRHARMKSSPDALLHLNARFDEYSDEEDEVDRNVDREIEFNDEGSTEMDTVNGSIGMISISGRDDGTSGATKEGKTVGWEIVARDDEGDTTRTATNDDQPGEKKTGAAVADSMAAEGETENRDMGEHDDDDDDDDDDDRDIIVHDDEVEEDEARPKKMPHASHMRSMSVDGIPF